MTNKLLAARTMRARAPPGTILLVISLMVITLATGCTGTLIQGSIPSVDVAGRADAGDVSQNGIPEGYENEDTPEDEEDLAVVIESVEDIAEEAEIEDAGGYSGEEAENLPQTHIIELTGEGFPAPQIRIAAGDSVSWKNLRTGRFDKAMVLGVRECRDLKSELYGPKESYQYAFREPMTCTIVDGVYTTAMMKVIVE